MIGNAAPMTADVVVTGWTAKAAAFLTRADWFISVAPCLMSASQGRLLLIGMGMDGARLICLLRFTLHKFISLVSKLRWRGIVDGGLVRLGIDNNDLCARCCARVNLSTVIYRGRNYSPLMYR